jgi:histidyl-tRNA synthetase
MSLSTQPYKGARDFYPEDKRLQGYLFNTWRQVVESFGYEEYDAPILEPLDIYLAKTNEEIINEQVYVFEDRGKRKVAIRPEMTPTVSRMVAARRQELAYPLRWYSIPNLWRYERPQRGRLREHWQLNVDIFGVKGISAEIELISLADAIFKAFGANKTMYSIRLNNRELVNYLLNDYLGISETSFKKLSRLIDRMAKMEKSDFIAELDKSLSAKERAAGITERLLGILEVNKLSDLPAEASQTRAYQELDGVLKQLSQLGLSNCHYDPSIMRGFDYYSGIVFEVFDQDPVNNRAMMGGGRYDGLVGLFGVSPVPTVGFGWGDVTLTNFLETHHLMPKLKPATDAYVALIGDVETKSLKVLAELRSGGLNLAVDLSGKRLGDQLKTADKKGIKHVIIIGEDELASGKFQLKDLASGKQQLKDPAGLIKELKDQRLK